MVLSTKNRWYLIRHLVSTTLWKQYWTYITEQDLNGSKQFGELINVEVWEIIVMH